jgi:hypothetical protein
MVSLPLWLILVSLRVSCNPRQDVQTFSGGVFVYQMQGCRSRGPNLYSDLRPQVAKTSLLGARDQLVRICQSQSWAVSLAEQELATWSETAVEIRSLLKLGTCPDCLLSTTFTRTETLLSAGEIGAACCPISPSQLLSDMAFHLYMKRGVFKKDNEQLLEDSKVNDERSRWPHHLPQAPRASHPRPESVYCGRR